MLPNEGLKTKILGKVVKRKISHDPKFSENSPCCTFFLETLIL